MYITFYHTSVSVVVYKDYLLATVILHKLHTRSFVLCYVTAFHRRENVYFLISRKTNRHSDVGMTRPVAFIGDEKKKG